MPGPLAALWLVIVVIAAVVLWSVERGWIGRRSTSTSGSDDDAVVTPVTATVAPAVLGYLVAAGDLLSNEQKSNKELNSEAVEYSFRRKRF